MMPCFRTESARPRRGLRLEAAARLLRVRVDRVDRDLEQLARSRRAADQDLEAAAEAATRCRLRRARQAPSPPSSRRRLRRSDGRRQLRAGRGSAPRRGAPTAARTCGRRASRSGGAPPPRPAAARRVRPSTIVRRTPPMREARVEPHPDQLDRLHELREALERVVLRLHRHEHAVGRGERVHGERPERRRAVEEDEVVLVAARRERLARGSARRRRGARARRPRRRGRASPGRGRGSRTRCA